MKKIISYFLFGCAFSVFGAQAQSSRPGGPIGGIIVKGGKNPGGSLLLNLGGGTVDTATPPMGEMTFTVMAALAQMELDIKRERITDSVSKRRAAGKGLGGRRAQFTDSQIRNARRLIDGGQSGTQVAKDLGMSRATMYRRMAEIEAREWIESQEE